MAVFFHPQGVFDAGQPCPLVTLRLDMQTVPRLGDVREFLFLMRGSRGAHERPVAKIRACGLLLLIFIHIIGTRKSYMAEGGRM